VSDSPSAGFIFSSSKEASPYGIFGRRVDVTSWGHNNGHDRVENINGQSPSFTPNLSPDRVDVVDINVSTEPPPDAAASPADAWRARNTYEEWASYFKFRGRPSDGTSFTEIMAFTAVAIVVLAVAFIVIRRRRRRRPPSASGPTPVERAPPPVAAGRAAR